MEHRLDERRPRGAERTGLGRPSALAQLLSTGLLVSIACGCAKQGRDAGSADVALKHTVDLLQSVPFELQTQTGRVVLGDDAWWAGRGQGWKPDTAGTLEVDRGLLEVTANAPLPKQLSVHTEGTVGELRIWLNEVELGSVPTPGTATIEMPESLWMVGSNQLAFERGEPAEPGSIELRAIEYGPRRSSDWLQAASGEADDPKTSTSLAPNTAAILAIESPGAVRVVGDFRSRGAGLFQLIVERLAPSDGERTELERREVDVFPTIDPRAPEASPTAAFDLDIALDADPAHPRLVTLRWLAEDGGPPLEILRLDRYESVTTARSPILFISIDTLAARHMSLYGYERRTTPNLERFATECLVFEQARSNAPWTIPSYASQLTGQLPTTHFVADLLDNWEAPPYEKYHVAENRWTLAEAMAASGYRTHAIVDNGWMAIVDGMLQGFQSVDLEPTQRPLADSEGGMRLVFPKALEWLSSSSRGGPSDGDQPYFLMLQVLDVHGPYLPIEGYRGKFGSTSLEGRMLPVVDQEPPTYGGIPDSIVPSLGLNPDEHDELPLDPFVAAYDEKILEFDAAIGAFLDDLRERPDWDDLLIIISADHGENMAAQEFYLRHGILNEETLHVPLLVRLPNGDQAGRRVDEKVDLVSLYPTLLEWLELESDRPGFHGRSIAAALRGDPIEEQPVLAFGSIQNMVSIETGAWKRLEYEAQAASLQTILTTPDLLELLIAEHPEFRGWIESADPESTLRRFARPGAVDALKAREPMLEDSVKRFLRERGPIVRWFDLAADSSEALPLPAGPDSVEREFAALLDEQIHQIESDRSKGTLPGAPAELSEYQRQELITLGYLDADD